jgi:hypothetical protein
MAQKWFYLCNILVKYAIEIMSQNILHLENMWRTQPHEPRITRINALEVSMLVMLYLHTQDDMPVSQ